MDLKSKTHLKEAVYAPRLALWIEIIGDAFFNSPGRGIAALRPREAKDTYANTKLSKPSQNGSKRSRRVASCF